MRIIFENVCMICGCAMNYFKGQTTKIPPRLIVTKTKKGDEHKMEQNEEFLQGSLSITMLQELQIFV